jgi:hypothetical protein
VRALFIRWLVFLAAFAVAAGPLAADAHLSLDPTGAEICSASHQARSSRGHDPQHHSQHQHDCCVAIAALDASGATSLKWQADWLTFDAPAQRADVPLPTLVWQLRHSRAPPSSLV